MSAIPSPLKRRFTCRRLGLVRAISSLMFRASSASLEPHTTCIRGLYGELATRCSSRNGIADAWEVMHRRSAAICPVASFFLADFAERSVNALAPLEWPSVCGTPC